jgi:hypothetical protein
VDEPETKIWPLTPAAVGADVGTPLGAALGVAAGPLHAATRTVVAIAMAAIVLPMVTWMALLF